MGRRVAFILASIHEGSSVHMWKRALSAFNPREDALFVFPGGRLDFKAQNEHLRNSIYDFVSRQNVDGVVAWTSSLTGDASAEQVCSFISRYRPLPLVTIGLKVDSSVPCVDFDAYRGFYSLVSHMIRVHHKKRIVYIRGPENHESSQDRYRAYCDALKDAGMSVDPDLVSSPFPWGEGKAALQEIIDGRGLVPSLDFDAVLCASDLMMFSAVRYLEQLGVNIPSSVAVGGFNDSETNKLLSVSPTTVRMPSDSMIDTAVANILAMLGGKEVPDDIKLDSNLVVRRSCGCRDSFAGEEAALSVLKDTPSFIKWATHYCDQKISEETLEYFTAFAQRLEKPNRNEKDVFLSRFSHLCRIFFLNGGEADDLQEIFRWFAAALPLSDEVRIFCKQNFDRVILDVYSHMQGQRQYHREETNAISNSFKMTLLGTRNMESFASSLCSYLKSLGFPQAYLVLNGEKGQHLVTGYNAVSSSLESEDFESGLLLPPRYRDLTGRGAFVVEPVIADMECIGHMVLEVSPDKDGDVIEDIMSSISSALKGINLLEDAKVAQERAEGAERTLKEFYANISEELREPLSSIRGLLQEMKASQTRDLVLSNVVKAEHLLDLVLLERGEVEVHSSLVDTKAFFSGYLEGRSFASVDIPDEIPAIKSDTALLVQALDILHQLCAGEEGGDQVSLTVSLTPNALTISLARDRWHPNLIRNNPSLQLAERTVVMLSGSFHFKDHSIMVSIPWPSLAGGETKAGFGSILFISEDKGQELPSWLSTFQSVEVVEAKELASSFSLPEGMTQLAYDASAGGGMSTVALNLLHNHHSTRDLPFLCTNAVSYGPDLWTSLCAASTASMHGTSADILCVGAIPEALSDLEAFGNRVMYESVDKLIETQTTPSLIILDTCALAELEKIRHNKSTTSTPVLIVKDHFSEGEIEAIMSIPSILVCNTCICASQEFLSRLLGIFAGGQILPPLTGALVKKAIVYLNKKAKSSISRWQIADSVNISEDYLTRIFKKEMGISPWDYLNRYRIQLATEMIQTTGKTINEVASEIGFQDQAYFCRVFKKFTGVAPGKLRR